MRRRCMTHKKPHKGKWWFFAITARNSSDLQSTWFSSRPSIHPILLAACHERLWDKKRAQGKILWMRARRKQKREQPPISSCRADEKIKKLMCTNQKEGIDLPPRQKRRSLALFLPCHGRLERDDPTLMDYTGPSEHSWARTKRQLATASDRSFRKQRCWQQEARLPRLMLSRSRLWKTRSSVGSQTSRRLTESDVVAVHDMAKCSHLTMLVPENGRVNNFWFILTVKQQSTGVFKPPPSPQKSTHTRKSCIEETTCQINEGGISHSQIGVPKRKIMHKRFPHPLHPTDVSWIFASQHA